MTENEISKIIVASAIEVHQTLGGPGLLESVYEEALAEELRLRGLRAERHLRLTRVKLGLVINFGERYVKNGIHRVVNGLDDEPLRLRAPASLR